MWCLMVGVVWVWNGWVDSDGWCHGGRRLLGHMMLTNGSGFCFEFYFIFLDLFEVWCKWIYLRWDVGWLIGWADLCLIALCDTRSNWVDLGLMEGGFLFLECNVKFYFSKWECMALIWKCMVFDDAENTTSKSHDPRTLLMAPAQQEETIFVDEEGW